MGEQSFLAAQQRDAPVVPAIIPAFLVMNS